MRLKESTLHGIDAFVLEGDIDLHYAPCLRSLMQAKLKARCPALIVDLARVNFIDSTGLSVIIAYYRDAAGHAGVLCLCALSEELKHIFKIVGLDRTIPIFNDCEDAAKAVASGQLAPAELKQD